MKNFALLDENNIVVNISIANNNWDSTGWIEYNLDNPASIGGDYVDSYFYTPQPYPSWNRNKGQWQPPVPYPTDELMYEWDEELTDWKPIIKEIN
jgi:hypothetical protein